MERITDCYLLNLKRSVYHLTGLYDRYLEDLGITFSQFCVLGNMERYGRIHITDLTFNCKLERPFVQRTVKGFVEQGLVVDVTEKESRTKIFSLSREGKKIVIKGRRIWEKAQADILYNIGERDSDALLRILRKMEEKYG